MLYFEPKAGSHVDLDLRLTVINAAAHMFWLLKQNHVTLFDIHAETIVSMQFYKGYVPQKGANRGKQWIGSAERTEDGALVCLSLRHESPEDFLRTLAHELIHVHQILRGDLFNRISTFDAEEEANEMMDGLVSMFEEEYPSLYSETKTCIGLCLL